MASEDPPVFKINRSMSSSFETTSNALMEKSFSMFGDGECGEPLLAQHLVIDFTPTEELDNDYVQKKCCAFWDYIRSQAELRNMMVLPDTNLYPEKTESSVSISETVKSETRKSFTNEKTALSMLEFVEGKGLIDRTFEAKLPRSICSLGSREYHENAPATTVTRTSLQRNECTCRGVCTSCRKKKPGDVPTPESFPEVKSMSKKMREWDSEHPKSLEPPGHPPALMHCIMQRKIIY